MDVNCPGVFLSVPQTASTFLKEDRVAEEKMMCTSVNTDGSVVYIYEKKGLEDSHVQRLLEVEKRRLLAEIETNDVDTLAMASYFHKIEKNGNVSEEPHQRVEIETES
ncbi:hypothetical protein Bca52824_003452 [Brassica carinata]|uniref:Uncharacterized protein n=1 Tax=Brassica carinata TaxID=52824 RepID=A0A8X8BEQ4_BRACI|nr:hypothetical protein Bca52824_003452 [Brassica carinata]